MPTCRSGNTQPLAPIEQRCFGAVLCVRAVPVPLGLTLIAAAIIRLTSPHTASVSPVACGSADDTPRSRQPAPHPDVFALVAPRRHGSRAETRSRLRLIGDRSRWHEAVTIRAAPSRWPSPSSRESHIGRWCPGLLTPPNGAPQRQSQPTLPG
jgi:hypothetical protein